MTHSLKTFMAKRYLIYRPVLVIKFGLVTDILMLFTDEHG